MVASNPNHPCPPPPGCARAAGLAESDRCIVAPSVREVVRLLRVFGRAICLVEEIARADQGGTVRIQEMAPVVDAINAYLASLPAAAAVERLREPAEDLHQLREEMEKEHDQKD